MGSSTRPNNRISREEGEKNSFSPLKIKSEIHTNIKNYGKQYIKHKYK